MKENLKKVIELSNYNFEIKKKIVENNGSKIFKSWQEHSTITKEDFLSALQWLCDDPNKEHPIREIGLTPTKIIKLYRVRDSLGFVSFFEWETHKRWEGAFFDYELNEKQRKIYEEKSFRTCCKIQLSPEDRI